MKHLFPFESQITYSQRKERMQQEPRLIFMTGLSGSGKSTLALRLEHYFFRKGFKVFLLDGDNIRNGLSKDLSFTEADRKENMRRVAEVAKLMLDAGVVVISAFISPYHEERHLVQDIVGKSRYIEVFINCSLEECERRDTKGLYAKARQGKLQHFTGISAPYEIPVAPDIEVKTNLESIEESLCHIIERVEPQLKDQAVMRVVSQI